MSSPKKTSDSSVLARVKHALSRDRRIEGIDIDLRYYSQRLRETRLLSQAALIQSKRDQLDAEFTRIESQMRKLRETRHALQLQALNEATQHAECTDVNYSGNRLNIALVDAGAK